MTTKGSGWFSLYYEQYYRNLMSFNLHIHATIRHALNIATHFVCFIIRNATAKFTSLLGPPNILKWCALVAPQTCTCTCVHFVCKLCAHTVHIHDRGWADMWVKCFNSAYVTVLLRFVQYWVLHMICFDVCLQTHILLSFYLKTIAVYLLEEYKRWYDDYKNVKCGICDVYIRR